MLERADKAFRQRDAVGLTLFADQVLTHLRPRGTADHQLEVLHTLAQQRQHPVSDNLRVAFRNSPLIDDPQAALEEAFGMFPRLAERREQLAAPCPGVSSGC